MNKNDAYLDELYAGTSMSRFADGLPSSVINNTFEDVTPSWATVNPDECVLHSTTDGKFAVVDHSIQTTVAVANTREGCYAFLHSISGVYCPCCGSKRMWDGGGYLCPPCDDEGATCC